MPEKDEESKAELLNDPAIVFFDQDKSCRHFFAIERSNVAGQRGDIFVDPTRQKFACVIIGNDGTFHHSLLKGIERKVRLSCEREITIGFLIIVLTDRFKLGMNDFGWLEGAPPKPPRQTARDDNEEKKLSQMRRLSRRLLLSTTVEIRIDYVKD